MSFKLNLLFIFSFLNCCAYEIVEHTTTTTPGCQEVGSYSVIESGFLLSESVPEQTELFSKHEEEFFRHSFHNLPFRFGGDAHASTKVYSKDGTRNSNVRLDSDHSYYLYNDTSDIQRFRVETKLFTHDYNSSEDQQVFILKPKEYIKGSKYLYFYNFYPELGSYKIYASTKISISRSYSSEDTNTVTIR